MVLLGTDVCFIGVLGESAFGVNGVAFGFNVGCLVVWRILLILVRIASAVVWSMDISSSDKGFVVCLGWLLFCGGF